MTYEYNKSVENFGVKTNNASLTDRINALGTYIMNDSTLFDVHEWSTVAHAGGFVVPFFSAYTRPNEDGEINYNSQKEMLKALLSWEKYLTKQNFPVHPKEQKMRLDIVRYLINIYKSKNLVYDWDVCDISKAAGINSTDYNWYGRDYLLKDVLVQACNYDAVESQMYRTITTSKFNIYETFFDYYLHDYKVFQIPKKIYDRDLEMYVDYSQPDYLVSDKELRLKEELESIIKCVPKEERYKFSKNKIKRY